MQQQLLTVKAKLTTLHERLQILRNNLTGLKKKLSKPTVQARKVLNRMYRWSFLDTHQDAFAIHNSDVNKPTYPDISHYQSSYSLARILLVVALKPTMFETVANDNLFHAVTRALGTGGLQREGFFQAIQSQGITMDFYVLVSGTKNLYNGDPPDNAYNIIYHGFLSKSFAADAHYFRQNVLMGAFGCDGVESPTGKHHPMPINSLEQRDVHFHDHAMSPDNARIKISAGRNISTFWSAGITLNKKRVVITYHLLINNKDVVEANFNLVRDPEKWGTLLKNIETLADSASLNTNHLDSTALKNFVAVLRKLK